MIEPGAQRDVAENTAYHGVDLDVPFLYIKLTYCISCAVHSHVVRVRSREGRRKRDPPVRFRFKNAKKPAQAAK